MVELSRGGEGVKSGGAEVGHKRVYPTIKRFVAKVGRVWVAKIGGCETG